MRNTTQGAFDSFTDLLLGNIRVYTRVLGTGTYQGKMRAEVSRMNEEANIVEKIQKGFI